MEAIYSYANGRRILLILVEGQAASNIIGGCKVVREKNTHDESKF